MDQCQVRNSVFTKPEFVDDNTLILDYVGIYIWIRFNNLHRHSTRARGTRFEIVCVCRSSNHLVQWVDIAQFLFLILVQEGTINAIFEMSKTWVLFESNKVTSLYNKPYDIT